MPRLLDSLGGGLLDALTALANINSAEFGDGSDGAATINGGTTTLAANKYYSSLTITSTGILVTANYLIRCAGTLWIQSGGILKNNGAPAAADVAGTAIAATRFGASLAGAAGGTGAGTNGNGGGANLGGAGGAGGSGNGGGNAGGSAVGVSTAAVLDARSMFVLTHGEDIYGGFGGVLLGSAGGGAAGGGDGTGKGGGGGGGAGWIAIVAKQIIIDGTLSALGGAGGNGAATNCGGGGGGGGGVVACFARSYSGGALPALGFSQNTAFVGGGAGGAKTGTGVAGSTGAAGMLWAMSI